MKACKGGLVEEEYVVLITREVLVALSFLHHANVIHRDIKGTSILTVSSRSEGLYRLSSCKYITDCYRSYYVV